MRPLAVLLALIVVISPFVLLINESVPIVGASSLSSWGRVFHLHDGVNLSLATYDWMNSTGPQNPTSQDYDSDGLDGVTIKKNVPPQRFHSWILYPAVDGSVVLDGDVSVSVWAKSRGNESGTIVRASFLDIVQSQFADPYLGTEIGSTTSTLTGPFYDNFQVCTLTVPSVLYTLPVGHFLALAIERGDNLNDWLIVHYDRTDRDSYVTIKTSTFISVDQAWSEDMTGDDRSTFSDAEQIVLQANISNPFGAYDIKGANASIYNATDDSLIQYRLTMQINRTDPSAIPRWKTFEIALSVLPVGYYRLNVTGRDAQGWPTWINIYVTVITVHHFGVSTPAKVSANSPFSLTITALDMSNQVMSNWTGPVQLMAYKSDRLTTGAGALSIPSVTIAHSDNGTKTITDEVYELNDFADEAICIRGFIGSKFGWSSIVNVSSGPVTSIQVYPLDPDGNATVDSGEARYFNATGSDSFGNANSTWTPYWNVTSGIGSVSQFGRTARFVGSTVGNGTLTCRNNMTGAYSNVTLVVEAGAIARMEILSPSNPLVVDQKVSVSLTAIGYDSLDNVIPLTSVSWYTTTAGYVPPSGTTVTYTAGTVPETGQIVARQGTIVATLNVTVTLSDYAPWLSPIPVQIQTEDVGSWGISLASYWQDSNGTYGLTWLVEDVDTSLYLITHDPEANAVMRFYTQPNQFGEDEFVLWVVDTEGYRAFQNVSVRIVSENDAPRFVNDPPTNLWVQYDNPYTFDFSYYVFDVDNSLSELEMDSQPSEMLIQFEGVLGTFTFPREIGEFEIVTLQLFDPMMAFSEISVAVRGTTDTPPDLKMELEDQTLYEGTMDKPVFDLDDYFMDVDGDDLYFYYGFANIVIDINQDTNVVYFSAPFEWSGTTMGTITARDDTGAIRTDTLMVTVIPVNDYPSVNLPREPFLVKYGVVYYLYLNQYVSDPDNSFDSLTYELDCPYVTHGVSSGGAQRLELLFPANLSGPVYTNNYTVKVRLDVTDTDMAQAMGTFNVTVTDNYPPNVIASDPDNIYFTFPEDRELDDQDMLNDMFHDEDDDDLTFEIESVDSAQYVHSAIDQDGVVTFTADVNWSGTQHLKIIARDDGGAWASLQFTVIVTPVNDAPVVDGDPMTPETDPIPDIVVVGGERSGRYYIGYYLVDSDNDLSELIPEVDPSENVQIVGGDLYYTLPSNLDVITVNLQVSDEDRNSNVASFRVGIEKTWAEKIGWPYSFPLVLLVAGVVGYFVGTRLPKPYALENLFLIHNDGRLITHVTKEENTNLDKDVVSAMFTAVQEFVRDSFQKGEVGLRKLEIGDKNVVIEKGKSAYLALIYSGWPPKEKFESLAMLLRDIEERYKTRLERWNGTMKALAGVDRMLQDYMAAGFIPGAWHEEAEIAEEEWVEILDKEA